MATKKPRAGAKIAPAQAAREAEARTRALVERFASSEARAIAALRRALRARLPGACEIVYEYRDAFVISYSASGKGHEGLLALRGDAKGVRLYFNRGAALADPDRVLQGTGRLVRFVPVAGREAGAAGRATGAAALAQPAIARLIDAAIEGHRPRRGGPRREESAAGAARPATAPAKGSPGAVVIRPTTASRKRRSK